MSRLRTTNPLARLRGLLAPLADRYSSLSLFRDRDLALLAGANFLDQLSVALIVPLLPTLADRLGADAALIGLIFAAETLARTLLAVPLGSLADRFERRPLVAAGSAVSGASVVALGLVGAPSALVGLRALDGAATALRRPATRAYVGDAFDGDERASALGAYRTVGMLGVAVGPALGGALYALAGLAAPFVVLGAATVAGALAVWTLLDPVEGHAAAEGEASGDAGGDGTGPLARTAATIRRLASPRRSLARLRAATPSMAALGVTRLLGELGSGAFGPLFAALLAATVGAGPGYAGLVYGLFGLAMFLSVPVGGDLADRRGRKAPLVAGKLVWAVVAVGLALAGSRAVPAALLIAAGVASGISGPALGALQYEVAPEGREGATLGAYSTLASAGATLGPILGGALADRVGVIAVFLAMGGLWTLDAVAVTVGVRETRPDD